LASKAGLKPGLYTDHHVEICSRGGIPLHFEDVMTTTAALVCDGCGQAASGEHIARRLRRLEWTTRYRPVHIHTLLLGAFSPRDEKDFLYAPGGEFQFHGEAAFLLDALGISTAGKAAEVVHAEFQRAGFFLTHVLECPFEGDGSLQADSRAALKARLAATATRIRRSLKPKRVMAVTEELSPVAEDILALDLGCPVLLDCGRPFRLESSGEENSVERFREVLAGAAGD
jgi:hypothetical protein